MLFGQGTRSRFVRWEKDSVRRTIAGLKRGNWWSMTLRLEGKNGVRAIKRGLERKENVFTFWGDRGAGIGCVKLKPQGNWGTKMYGGLILALFES